MVATIVNEFAKVAAVEKIELDVPEVIAHCESCFDLKQLGYIILQCIKT